MARWPIRIKLLFGLIMVLSMLGILAAGSIHGLRSYRRMIKICQNRAEELSYVTQLWAAVRLLERPDADADAAPVSLPAADISQRERFTLHLKLTTDALEMYRKKVSHNAKRDRDPDPSKENKTIEELKARLDDLTFRAHQAAPDWNAWQDDGVQQDLKDIETLVSRLPRALQADFDDVLFSANQTYLRTLWLTGGSSLFVVLMLIVVVWLFYTWVFRPIRKLHHGSRRVANGNFAYRIRLDTRDEMAELAAAFNHMTSRFRRIYVDLDRQVHERSRQLIRSERLAGVGFLAAGVAHEINNPLMSIALASESLEHRLREYLAQTGGEQADVVRQYLRMIHEEAFRCKGITERLLDFSRMGDLQRQRTDLVQLVEDVVEMVRHLGKYRGKQIIFEPCEALIAPVNPQEIKQVVLNLVTNALESMDENGTLTIQAGGAEGMAELAFADDGCGMTPEVLENLFEPFFTRRRSGQGTGLGLSITHRIVNQHGGEIEATSPGPDHGSTLTVRLPLNAPQRTKQEMQEHALS